MRIAAVTVGLPSFLLVVVARIQLGGSFSVEPRPRRSLPMVFALAFLTLSTFFRH